MRTLPLLLSAVLYAQTAPLPGDVRDSAREQIRSILQRLPRYTCLQTIDRTYDSSPAPLAGKPSCDRLSADRKHGRKPLHVEATDRLRMEVAQGADEEMHSWPGASRFDLVGIDQIVDSGPLGTGAFGGYLVDIFENEGAQFDDRGNVPRGDKSVMVFGYTVGTEASHYDVRAGNSWVTTAYSGTVEVDPQSSEILRVTVQTSELPAETGSI